MNHESVDICNETKEDGMLIAQRSRRRGELEILSELLKISIRTDRGMVSCGTETSLERSYPTVKFSNKPTSSPRKHYRS